MRKLALLGLVVTGFACSIFHRPYHETINKAVPGRTSLIARLAGTNVDSGTITVLIDTRDTRVFRLAQSVQGSLGDLHVGDPVILSFDMSRGDTVVSVQPVSMRPGLASAVVIPAPLPETRPGILFHAGLPEGTTMEAAMNARVVSVSPGDSSLVIRTPTGERTLTVAPEATAALNQLGPGDEVVIGFDSASHGSVVSIHRSGRPATAPAASPRGAVEEAAPARPAEATPGASTTGGAAQPAPARRRPARRRAATGTAAPKPASTARPPATSPPTPAATPVPLTGAAAPMPTPRPVPTPIPVPTPRSATTPEPFPPFPTPTPVPTPR